MGAIKIESFIGMIPAQDPSLLPNSAASDAIDAWISDGSLQGWKAPVTIRPLSDPNASVVFRVPRSSEIGRAPDFEGSRWFEFTDPFTDVVKSPLANDAHGRIYVASPSSPPKYISADRASFGLDFLLLGIPAPDDALSVTAPDWDTSAPHTVRSYVFTWVSEFGEEGPPSPAVTRTGNQVGSWDVAFPSVPPNLNAQRSITKRRVYRTVTGSNGVADFYPVGDFGLSETAFSDTANDSDITGLGALPSASWTPPPALQGIVALPNGMLAGWVGSEVWFCEPYRPHAWPGKYALSFGFPIVGLGFSGVTLVVLTTGHPYAVTGSHPSQTQTVELNAPEPCLGRRSIVSSQDGVYYASPNGLVCATGALVFPATHRFVRKTDWMTLTDPYSFRAVRVNASYTAIAAGSGNGVHIDTSDGKIVFVPMRQGGGWKNLIRDIWSSELLLVGNGVVARMDPTGDAPTIPFRWRSKIFQLPKKDNLGAAKVFFRVPPGSPPQGEEVASPQTLSGSMLGIIRMFASLDNGSTYTLVGARELRRSGVIIRLPSGFKSEFWQFEIEGRVDVSSVQLAVSARELASV